MSGDKGPKPWPNFALPDNYILDGLLMDDPDRQFSSPNLLNMTNPEQKGPWP